MNSEKIQYSKYIWNGSDIYQSKNTFQRNLDEFMIDYQPNKIKDVWKIILKFWLYNKINQF